METLPLGKALAPRSGMREFNQPELTGPSGEPVEVPDSLAARILAFALEDRDSFALMEDADPLLIASVLAHAKALAGEKKENAVLLASDGEVIRREGYICTPFGPSLPAKDSSATLASVMKLDQKEGFTSFDDGPELVKLHGWYDRVRKDAGDSPCDGMIEEGDAAWISTKVQDSRKASCG